MGKEQFLWLWGLSRWFKDHKSKNEAKETRQHVWGWCSYTVLWFKARGYADILLCNKTWRPQTWVLLISTQHRNSHLMSYMRCCMIFIMSVVDTTTCNVNSYGDIVSTSCRGKMNYNGNNFSFQIMVPSLSYSGYRGVMVNSLARFKSWPENRLSWQDLCVRHACRKPYKRKAPVQRFFFLSHIENGIY